MKKITKRLFDLTTAIIGLAVCWPLLLVIACIVRITLGSPVLFRQRRPGLHGKLFTIYKFRTMLDGRDVDGDLLPDSVRLTRVGWFLRSTSLDELPELINVLMSDMSIVGPRPLLVEYLSKYTPEQARRHEVRPGITGWAQVNGRQDVSFSRRFELDVWYVDNWDLFLDLKIIFLTVWFVLTQKGVKAGIDLHEDDLGFDAKSVPRGHDNRIMKKEKLNENRS